MKILIVEDDVMLALSMEDTLHEVGHVIVGMAREPAAAFRLAGSARPDLALVDLTLARGSSGADVARHLRERYSVPAVFVSGAPGACKRVGFHIGALGCLAKPFTPDELIDGVDAASMILQKQSPERLPPNMELYFVL